MSLGLSIFYQIAIATGYLKDEAQQDEIHLLAYNVNMLDWLTPSKTP